MKWLTPLNARLSRWSMYIACTCLAGLLGVVVYGVVMRYVFNDAPPYVEQAALLLVISVAMFGAASGTRDVGHIGLDSIVVMLPQRWQFWCAVGGFALSIEFGVALLWGSAEMGVSTYASTIPTIGISEGYRYLPVFTGGLLIALFSLEHLIARIARTEVSSSWH